MKKYKIDFVESKTNCKYIGVDMGKRLCFVNAIEKKRLPIHLDTMVDIKTKEVKSIIVTVTNPDGEDYCVNITTQAIRRILTTIVLKTMWSLGHHARFFSKKDNVILCGLAHKDGKLVSFQPDPGVVFYGEMLY